MPKKEKLPYDSKEAKSKSPSVSVNPQYKPAPRELVTKPLDDVPYSDIELEWTLPKEMDSTVEDLEEEKAFWDKIYDENHLEGERPFREVHFTDGSSEKMVEIDGKLYSLEEYLD